MPQTRVHISVTGRAANIKELREGKKGDNEYAFLNFSLAQSFSYFDADEKEWVNQDPEWFNVVVSGNDARRLSENLKKGMIVTVTGDVLQQRNYVDRNGEERPGQREIRANSVALELTAKIYDIEEAQISDEKRDKVKTKPTTSKRSKPVDDDPFDDDEEDEEIEVKKKPARTSSRTKAKVKTYETDPLDDEDDDDPFA